MNVLQRCAKSPACWLGALIVGGGVASNLGAGFGGADSPQQAQLQTNLQSAEEKVMREGTRIENRPVEVRQESDRVAVYLQGTSVPLIALENLAMQRILRAIVDEPADNNWTVTGTVTEFQGRNFLLLERVNRVAK